MILLYTGRSGGIGRCVAAAAGDLGHEPLALSARLEDSASLRREFAALAVPRGAHVALLHLAAMVSVDECEADPKRATSVNVGGSLRLVRRFAKWAERSGVRARVVFVSTAHVYARAKDSTPVAETADIGPMSAYARSKLAAEVLLSRLLAGRKIPLVVARVFGVLSPEQREGYLLPGLILRMRADPRAAIPGLDHVRDYLDARDVARCLVHLAVVEPFPCPLPPPEPCVVNVCSGVPTRVRDVAAEVLRALHPRSCSELAEHLEGTPARSGDAPHLVGSCTKLRSILEGEPRTIALRQTVQEGVAASDRPRR